MDEKRLAEIEGRAAKATPGPWEISHWTGAIMYRDGNRRKILLNKENLDTVNFIIHSRRDIPELLVEVKRLRELLHETAEEMGSFPGLDVRRRQIEEVIYG